MQIKTKKYHHFYYIYFQQMHRFDCISVHRTAQFNHSWSICHRWCCVTITFLYVVILSSSNNQTMLIYSPIFAALSVVNNVFFFILCKLNKILLFLKLIIRTSIVSPFIWSNVTQDFIRAQSIIHIISQCTQRHQSIINSY